MVCFRTKSEYLGPGWTPGLFPGLILGILLAWSAATAEPLYAALNEASRRDADTALQLALETSRSNVTYLWQSATGDISGRITPLRTFRIRSGHYCREFEEVIVAAAQVRLETRTACRNDDGRWQKILDE